MKLSIIAYSCVLTLGLAACVQDQPSISESDAAGSGNALVLHDKAAAAVPATEQALPSSLAEYETTARFAPQRKMAREQVDLLFSQSSLRQADSPVNREVYAARVDNAVKLVNEEPVSTFSIDVDTGAYAVVRRHLNQGVLPPSNASPPPRRSA